MSLVSQVLVAYLFDLAVGDPGWLPHPVRFWGYIITSWEDKIMPKISAKKYQRAWGVAFALALIFLAFAGSWLLIHLLSTINPILGTALSIYLISTTVATRELGRAAKSIKEALREGDLGKARNRVSKIVARDTGSLRERELVRATIESVSENAVDGIIAPLFYAFLGGAPLAMLYRAANTLDSRLGFKHAPYRYWGWASARIDDILNYIPARFCYLVIPLAAVLLGKRPAGLRIIRQDARKHPSPNAGIPEAAVAVALGVRLGGFNSYEGRVEFRPYLGEKRRGLDAGTVEEAIRIVFFSSLIALVAGTLVSIALGKIG